MFKKLTLLFLVVLFVLPVFTGCKKEAETIKIGLQAPITGEYAYEGEGFVKVVDLATEQINEEGILDGRKIEIVKCDDVGKPDESSKCANQLVSAGVQAVVGSYSSTCTEPASEIYNEAGLLQITPSSTATRLSQKGFQRFFRVCFLDDRQGLFAANFMKDKLAAGKVGIIHDNSTYAQGLAEHTKRYSEEAGIEVVIFDALNPEDTDFKPLLTKIDGLGPDVVYFTGYHPQGGLLLKQSKELGTAFQRVMGNACNNPEMTEIAGLYAAKGTYITTEPLPKDIPGDVAKKFYDDFVAKYGEPPASIWWVMAGDALRVVVKSMEETDSTDSEKMAEYLHTQFKDYPGVTGNIIGFDEKGDRLGTVHEAYIISDAGEFEVVK
ncbi:MAG: branched-chain amino acid ABC transporter substrate-binding protein [Anaerolineae bacterium]|nr:MAG: branched-chain amino acid ABC transporter substrate-binding protein [Anaerolineae bacterium]